MRVKYIGALALSGAVLLSTALVTSEVMAQGMAFNASHVQLSYVAKAFQGAPEGKGLLQTAFAEADIAIQHAGLAAKKADDLAYVQKHMAHVRHAIDPSVDKAGPGLGFGFKQASAGVVKHTEKAIAAYGASDNVKTHGLHVATSAMNGLQRSDEILSLIEKIMAAGSGAEAKPDVLRVHELAKQLKDGADANGDGSVSWQKGEGGLQVAAKHVGFLFEGEDLEKPEL